MERKISSEALLSAVQKHIDISDTPSTKLPSVIHLADLKPETIEVMEWFGIDAAHLLNKYACSVEDALIKVCDRNKILTEENARLRELLPEE